MTRNRRYLLLTYGLLLIALCALVFVPELYFGGKTKDYPRWFWVGTQFITGGSLYDGFNFLYPPFAALLMAIPVPLGKIGFYISLIVINWFAWIAVVELSIRLIGDVTTLKPWQVILPTLLTLPFLIEIFDLGQPNILLLAMMLFGFHALQKARPILAGLSFGAAVAIKLFPISVLPYLLWRRHWNAALILVASAFALTFFAPAPIRGFERNVAEVEQWFDGMKGGEDGFGQRKAQNWSWKNQSIIAMTHRLLRPLDYRAVDRNADPQYMNFLTLDYKTANLVVAAVAALLGLGFILLIPKERDRTPNTDRIEFAILLCLMTIASPLARSYYFVWLYFPLALLIYQAAKTGDHVLRRMVWRSITVATGFGLLAVPLFPKFLQAAGNNLVMTGIIIGALIGLMRISQSGRRIMLDISSVR